MGLSKLKKIGSKNSVAYTKNSILQDRTSHYLFLDQKSILRIIVKDDGQTDAFITFDIEQSAKIFQIVSKNPWFTRRQDINAFYDIHDESGKLISSIKIEQQLMNIRPIHLSIIGKGIKIDYHFYSATELSNKQWQLVFELIHTINTL